MNLAAFRPRGSLLRFSVLFTLLLYGACNALVLDRLTRWFPGPAGLALGPFAAYLVAGYALFLACFLLLAHRYTVKPLALLLCLLGAAATYFIAKYDVAIDSSMILNAFHTDRTEVGQLLSPRMVPYVVGLFLLPGIVILVTHIDFGPSAHYLKRSLAAAAIAVVVAAACLASNLEAIQRAGNVSNKYILYSLVPVNLLYGGLNLASKSVASLVPSHRRIRDVAVTMSHPENLVVVLAVGESSRRDSFSLYGRKDRDTTPELGRIPGLHALDGIARKGSTIYALPQILEKSDVKLTEVVAKAGVPATCFVNYSLYDNCLPTNEIAPDRCGHEGRCYDEDVLPLLHARLQQHAPGKELVVLHFGGGSHGPIYRDRHPPEFLRFQPICTDADVANRCTLQQLHNAYDDTILYVDHVVSGAIAQLEASGLPYVFLYLSDHGESLLEGGRLFHGMPPGMTLPPEQARIPLLVKASVPLTIEPRDEYSQPAVFDSVLALLSIRADALGPSSSFLSRP